MKKFDIGQMIGILANIGVIAGIVFLGIEIRQNTQSLQISAYQQLISQLDSMARLRLQDSTLGMDLNSNIHAYPQDLTDEDTYRIWGLFYILTRSADLAYYQFQQGALTEARLQSAIAPLQTYLCSEAYKDFWMGARVNFVTEFRKFIETKFHQC